jgi:copper chaperone CopZ
MDCRAAPGIGRFGGFEAARQREIGKDQVFPLSQVWRTKRATAPDCIDQPHPAVARVHHIGMATQTLRLNVHGMTCGNCARSVERKLSSTPGVSKATVDLVNQNATIDYDDSAVKPESLAAAVRLLGFEVPA